MIRFQCTVNHNGEIEIPDEIRTALKLTPGTILHGQEENGRLMLMTESRMLQLIDELQGSTSGAGELREREHRD